VTPKWLIKGLLEQDIPTDPVVISTLTFLGEFLLAAWLIVRGRHVQLGPDHEV
jgi:hypothetical protein